MTIPELGNAMQNLDRLCQLHESIEIIYVVDGYSATLIVGDDGWPFVERTGPTIQEALVNLDAALEGVSLDFIRGGGSAIQGDNSTDKASRGKGVGDYRL